MIKVLFESTLLLAVLAMVSCDRRSDNKEVPEQDTDKQQSEIIDLVTSRIERQLHCLNLSRKAEIPLFTQEEIQQHDISVAQLLAQIRIKHHQNRIACAGDIDNQFSSVWASYSNGELANISPKEIDALGHYCLYIQHSRFNPEMQEAISLSKENVENLSEKQLSYINEKLGDDVFSFKYTEKAIIYSFDDPLADLLKQADSTSLNFPER